MNPLNVLRGNSVMTPASSLRRENGAVVIDTGGIRVMIDADDKPIGVTVNGRTGRITTTNGETGAVTDAGADMIVAPVDLTLRAAIALKQQTDHPIPSSSSTSSAASPASAATRRSTEAC